MRIKNSKFLYADYLVPLLMVLEIQATIQN